VCHVCTPDGLALCLDMVTGRSARLMRLDGHTVAVGSDADLTVLDAPDAATAVAELAQPLYGFKRGRPTFTRHPAELHRPGRDPGNEASNEAGGEASNGVQSA
jgi:cytosine/creatinine deaminase